MLALYGMHRVHDKGMKFAGAQGTYCDGRCSMLDTTSALYRFIEVHRSQEFGDMYLEAA
jgi:hypothetical protein